MFSWTLGWNSHQGVCGYLPVAGWRCFRDAGISVWLSELGGCRLLPVPEEYEKPSSLGGHWYLPASGLCGSLRVGAHLSGCFLISCGLGELPGLRVIIKFLETFGSYWIPNSGEIVRLDTIRPSWHPDPGGCGWLPDPVVGVWIPDSREWGWLPCAGDRCPHAGLDVCDWPHIRDESSKNLKHTSNLRTN